MSEHREPAVTNDPVRGPEVSKSNICTLRTPFQHNDVTGSIAQSATCFSNFNIIYLHSVEITYILQAGYSYTDTDSKSKVNVPNGSIYFGIYPSTASVDRDSISVYGKEEHYETGNGGVERSCTIPIMSGLASQIKPISAIGLDPNLGVFVRGAAKYRLVIRFTYGGELNFFQSFR